MGSVADSQQDLAQSSLGSKGLHLHLACQVFRAPRDELDALPGIGQDPDCAL